MIPTAIDLKKFYTTEKKSVKQIATLLSCSENKINYWLKRYGIPKRSISDATYIRLNPTGDPFTFKAPKTIDEAFLFGMGIGLYWGEGNKKNKTTVRLGNTDPKMILKFLDFITVFYGVDEHRIRFGLQIFSDMDPKETLQFWMRTLKVPATKFGKVIVTPSRGIGTYREKTKYGVLTIYISNTKLRNLICAEIEKL